jgi:hypothetical protein
MPGQPITFDTSKPVPVSPTTPPPPNTAAVEVTLTPPVKSGTVLIFEVTVTDNLGQKKIQKVSVKVQGTLTVGLKAAHNPVAPGAPIGLTTTASVPGGTISKIDWALTSIEPPRA